jgi:hypothetical protein
MKNYSKKEVEAAKARNTHGQDVVGVGAGGTTMCGESPPQPTRATDSLNMWTP